MTGGATAASAPRIVVGTVAVEGWSGALEARVAAVLSTDERARAARFRAESHRHQFVAAHGLKRRMLEEIGGRPARDWVFATGPHGKPVVAGDQGPHFNLSHCEGLVACAVSLDGPLGLDVEPLDGEAAPEVAERFFAPDERAWLASLPETACRHGFFRLWTAKEAFVKATGQGVAADLAAFAVAFDPPRLIFPGTTPPEPGTWRLHQALVGDRHVLALCWEGPDTAVMVRVLAPEALAGG